MSVVLNKGQEECLVKLLDWWKTYDGSRQVFGISGLAGCGKTFVIKYLIDILDDLDIKNVLFVAFVGKAAMQMTKSGVNASTIHSAIYYPVEIEKKDENGKPVLKEGRPVKEIRFVKKPTLGNQVKLIVVDEAPMVDAKVAKDLLSFNLPMITLGDLNQLPPIFGDSYFLRKPDHTLTEIMRQKAGNPILSLAKEIIHSNGDLNLSPGVYGNKLMIIRAKDFNDEYIDSLIKSDIVICGRNTTREDLNNKIRKLYFENKGIEGTLPELLVGDKLICRKNNWGVTLDNINLINGLIGEVTNIYFEDITKDIIPIDFKPDFLKGNFTHLDLNVKYFTGTKQYKEMIKKIPHNGELFEYGYAITCHLSQGSQYNKVIVFAEKLGDAAYYKRWLYTAVTRASDKLILII